MKKWIGPVYKILAKSELGSEHGHTSGIVPTRDTSSFFGDPILYKKTHTIKKIIIELSFADQEVILKANVIYFYSKTHKHIHLTGGGLMPTYKKWGAREGDVILFWRSTYDPTYYKARLIKKGSSELIKIKSHLKGKGGFIKKPLQLDINFFNSEYEDDYQQESVIDTEINDTDFPPIRKPSLINKSQVKRFPRNKAKGDYVLKKSNYECTVNKAHKTFITKIGNSYMEKHHLIPLSNFENFQNSLDDINNIICICPLCHRKLHAGRKDEVLPILKKLWTRKKNDLNKSGLSIEFDDLVKNYFD